jgi:hypothetical protein
MASGEAEKSMHHASVALREREDVLAEGVHQAGDSDGNVVGHDFIDCR